MRKSVRFQPEKFRELLVYIAEQVGHDQRFGDVKLNKILFFSDFRAYNRLGHAITGARYQKQRMGPTAVALLRARNQLVTEGAVEVRSRRVGQHEQTATIARRGPQTGLFTPDELAIVDGVIQELRPLSADDTSDLSHTRSPGWTLVDMGDVIPYQTALISPEPPPEHVLARGRELAARHGW
jgi:hypothetical protein